MAEVVILSEKRNIIKYKNTYDFNISFIIFLIIIIYVLFNVFSYFTQNKVAEYEVQQGTIASNDIYQGIIIRDETIEYASKEGYINYFTKNGSKVSTKDIIYSIDTLGTISNELSATGSDDYNIPKDILSSISKNTNEFIGNYNSMNFSDSYVFWDDLNADISHTIHTTVLDQLSDEVIQAEKNETFFQYTSPTDGTICYSMDGYENKTVEDYVENGISVTDYKKTIFQSNQKVNTSTPVYKRVNSEDWNVLISIDKKLAKELIQSSVVKVRFCKDDFTTNANYTIIQSENGYYLNLSFRTAMVRYINERFVDIELILKDTTGLKIPKSSITSKEFFTIPKKFFYLGGNSDNLGILVKQQKNGAESVAAFISPTIYHETEEYYYIDNEYVSDGDMILMENSVSTYKIGAHTDSLIGVYNINKGYAVFKQIQILYENEEYAIVETKTPYGIALYDHIALDASKISEHQLTTK